MKRLLLGCLLAACCSLAQAHKPSDAYLTLIRDDAALSGQLDIALRDLDNALGLDANGDGDVTWGELRAREADVAAYALDRLRVASAGEPCALRATRQLVDAHTDGTYAVLMLSGACATNGGSRCRASTPPRKPVAPVRKYFIVSSPKRDHHAGLVPVE